LHEITQLNERMAITPYAFSNQYTRETVHV
jgi:hypothetical protein